jgi:hypothetical protein
LTPDIGIRDIKGVDFGIKGRYRRELDEAVISFSIVHAKPARARLAGAQPDEANGQSIFRR